MAEEPGNRNESCSGDVYPPPRAARGRRDPRNPACESTANVSREQPRTQTTAQPPSKPQTPATSRTSRADAKFAELLAQAREIMADPEFMEEVMALVRLKTQLETELSGVRGGALVSILARSFGRRRKQ